MGVIHKLTDEVVQFILEVKKEQPSISCRKLADTVSARFNIPVSKSSVNTVLKNHELSGAIGRPPGIHSKKSKFTIPVERKKQLLGDVATYKDEPAVEVVPPEAAAPVPERHVEEPVATPTEHLPAEADVPAKEAVKEKEEPPSVEDESLQLMPDPMQQDNVAKAELPKAADLPEKSAEEDFQLIKERFESSKSPTYQRAGVALLKAAQSELSLISVFSRLLEKHTDVGFAKETRSLCEAICYLRFLGIRDAQEVTASKADIVWALLGQDLRDPTQRFLQRMQSLKMPRNFDVIFLNEMQQYGVRIRSFRIFLEDGSEIMLDADMCSLGEGAGIRQRPLEKALSDLSSAIISNNEPVIIAQAPSKEEIGLRNLIEAFEAVPGKRMVRIHVLDENNQKLAEFATIPQMARTFVAGIFPPHKLFREITRSAKWAGTQPVYSPEFDDSVNFSQIGTEFFVQQWDTGRRLAHLIVLWKQESEEPVGALLSNDPRLSPAETVRRFMGRWPHLVSQGPETFNSSEEVDNTKNSIVADFMDCFDDLNQRALSYMGQRYFSNRDINHLMGVAYGLKGYLVTREACQKVALFAEGGKDADLSGPFRMLNQANIIDFQGRRLSFA